MQNGLTGSRRAAGATFCGLLAALAVTGCSHDEPATPPTNTVVNTAPAPAPSTTTTVTTPGTTTTTSGTGTKINTNAGPGTSNGTDTTTATAVNAAIVRNKQMTGSRVEAVVTAGVARLNGTVQNQQQKALAATTASNTPGVSSVINKLQITPTGGAHGTPAKPKTIVKVFNHTTVVHDKQYVPVPVPANGGNSGANSGGGANGSNDNGTGDNNAGGSGNNSANPPAAPNPPATAGTNP